MIWTLCTAALLTLGCGNADAPSSKKADAPVAPAAKAAPAAAQPDVTVSAKWKSGVTDANAGDKVGKVRLHGSMPAGNGTKLYLYETEGRNLTLMDSTTVQNQAFDFGQVEVHRGFYQMAGVDAKNNCQFIMNPDEADLNLVFRSKQMTSGKTAAPALKTELGSRTRTSAASTTTKSATSASSSRTVLPRPSGKADFGQGNGTRRQAARVDGRQPGTYIAKFLGWKTPNTPTHRAISSTTSTPWTTA